MLEVEQKLVLKRINEIRKEAGLGRINKLKRGVQSHPTACPIAMSLAGTPILSWGHFWATEPPKIWEPAEAIARAFDEGKMPELELPKTPVKIRYSGDRKATVIE